MTEQILDRGIGLLVSCFPDKVFDHKAYWHLLQDLPDDEFIKAVEDVCKSSKDIYPGTNIIAMIREKAIVKPKMLAGEAWEKVLVQVRECWEHQKPVFKDPLIAKAVDCVGWNQIYNSEKLSIERSCFVKVYDQLIERNEKEDVLGLPGGDKKQIGEVKNLISDTVKKLSG